MLIYKVKILHDFEIAPMRNIKGGIYYGMRVNGCMMVYINDYGLYHIPESSKHEVISEIDLESLEAKLEPRREFPLMSTPSLQKYIGEGLSKLTVEFK